MDEAFLDAVPGEPETLVGVRGVLVLRSLTKHWSIPGIRAGYAIGEPGVVARLQALQTPWSVSSPAIAAMVAIAGAAEESRRRARRPPPTGRGGSPRQHLRPVSPPDTPRIVCSGIRAAGIRSPASVRSRPGWNAGYTSGPAACSTVLGGRSLEREALAVHGHVTECDLPAARQRPL